jgi:hypothetical protein
MTSGGLELVSLAWYERLISIALYDSCDYSTRCAVFHHSNYTGAPFNNIEALGIQLLSSSHSPMKNPGKSLTLTLVAQK